MITIWRHGIALAMLLATSTAAYAEVDCDGGHGGYRLQTSDGWFQSDKLKHFAVSAPFGALGAYLTRDTEHPVIYGTLIGTIPLDQGRHRRHLPYQRLFLQGSGRGYSGRVVGALLTNWAITLSRDTRGHTVAVSYRNRF